MVHVKISGERLHKLAELFAKLGIENAKKFEDIDPQYRAVKQVVEMCEYRYAVYAFYINAINAFRLKMKGELFWQKFADMVTRFCSTFSDYNDVVELVKQFTYEYNNYAYNTKIARLQEIAACSNLKDLAIDGNYLLLANETARCLNTSVESKTVVFSIKMVYYVRKARGVVEILPFELPIPVDTRVAKISHISGLIDVHGSVPHKYSHIYGLLVKKADVVRKAWNSIALESRIPALHIDAVLWYFGKFLNKYREISDIAKEVQRELQMLLNRVVLGKLVEELFWRLRS